MPAKKQSERISHPQLQRHDTARSWGGTRIGSRDADGLVRYQTDIAILRPKDGRHASRVVIDDVVNRGRPVAAGLFARVADLTGAAGPAQDFTSILQHGHTLVWSGWQGDVPLHAASKVANALVAARLLLPADAECRYGTQAAGRIDTRLLP